MSLAVAVVGFGAFGKNHARVYASLPGVELAAIVDPDPRCQAEARELYPGVKVGPYLEGRKVAAASVAVPTEGHARVAEELLLAGVPCLVEKPMAASLQQAGRMITVARNVGVPVFVGHLERFNPAWRRARAEIHAPRFVEVHRLGSFSPRSLDIDVVLDLMIHDLDLLLQMAGSFPERVEAIGVNVLTPKVDIANARLSFADGLVANVTASRVSKERIRKLRVFQPHCYMSLDLVERRYELYRVEPAAPGERPRITSEDVRPPEEEPLRAEIVSFLGAAVEGKPAGDLATGEDGLAALKLAMLVAERMKDASPGPA